MTIGFIELERRLSVVEEKLAGRAVDMLKSKPLTFTDPECNTPCNAAEEVLRDKVERLIAYFEKHARENEKRAEKIEKSRTEAFHQFDKAIKMDRSSYYLSGKSDAYQRAAEKVRELLGEPKYSAMFGEKPEYVYVPVEPNPPERWIVEKQHSNVWSRSLDVPQEFSSEAGALQGIAEAVKKFGMSLVRRARRID